MRVAIVGAGGIGCIYGASLAKAGAEVVFLARGAHLAALRANGLRIEGGRGETHIDPVQATDDPASVGIVDYAIFCVKLWDVESAGAAIKPLVGRETAVIPQQNGVDAHERLIPILGREAVMGGTASRPRIGISRSCASTPFCCGMTAVSRPTSGLIAAPALSTSHNLTQKIA